MPFFQNVFAADFQGNWVLADRSQSLRFDVPNNSGRGNELVTVWEEGPYDLSGVDGDGNATDTLILGYAIDGDFQRWVTLSVDVTATAASALAVTPSEIISALNADATFTSFFSAELGSFGSNSGRVTIRTTRDANRIKFFVFNGRAESVLRFNARAGVAELPEYFGRHNLSDAPGSYTTDRFDFDDSQRMLIELDPDAAGGASAVDTAIIDAAVDEAGVTLGLDSSTEQADWELLRGRSGLFTFQNICLDTNGDIAQIIEYHAGAVAGDMARKICYFRDAAGAGSNPVQITEEPYVLTDSDLIEPDCSECSS
jgi:hypothetical protein